MGASELSQNGPSILIVDDDREICEILSRLLIKERLRPLVAHEGDTALKMIRSRMPDVVLLDMRLPGMDGMEVLKRAKDLDEALPVVMITGYADLEGAVEAMRAGAHDYLAKPFDHNELSRVVNRALAERALKRKLRDLSTQANKSGYLKKMMGPSDPVERLISKVNCVAGSDFTVVILGETGSGKELVAQAIHQASPRSGSPFVPVDCGSIPETLLESELFGHEKGAFTGAEYQKRGKFELAKGGTLFLDEISNMPLGSQAKLLRVLQEKKVYRVGGTKPISVDVRILAASNQDLEGAQASDSFRRDLYFRLNEFTIKIPPLRERKDDIPYLANRFLEITNIELKKNVKRFSESALESLIAFNWPGNVRQLRSTIRRAVLLSNEMITRKHLDLKRGPDLEFSLTPELEEIPWKNHSLREVVRKNRLAVEREVIAKALEYTGGNKAKAARLLKIDYKTIHTKVKQLEI